MGNPLKIEKRFIFIVFGILALALIILYASSKKTGPETLETSTKPAEIVRLRPLPPPPPPGSPQVMEISGLVSEVNLVKNSFKVTSRDGKLYEVFLGEKTELKEYAVSSSQAVSMAIEKLKKGDQVAVTASDPIYFGKAINNPTEVQVFH